MSDQQLDPDAEARGGDASDPSTGPSSAPVAAEPSTTTRQQPSLTKRDRRIGERVIEGGIRLIATLSIIFIFLIFLYVFREASPIVFGPKEKPKPAATSPTPTHDSGPIQYGGTDSGGSSGTATEDGAIQYNPSSTPSSPSTPAQSDQQKEDGPKEYNPEAPSSPPDNGSPNNGSRDTAGGSTTPTDDDSPQQYNPPGPDDPKMTGEAGSPPVGSSGDEQEIYNPTTGEDSTFQKNTEMAQLPPPATDNSGPTRDPDYPLLDHDSPVKVSHLFYHIWQPNSEHPRYGIWPIVLGTLKTSFVALLIAIPLSILAALYTAFFAPNWVREYLKPAIELLAAFPSVVIGFFCLLTVASHDRSAERVRRLADQRRGTAGGEEGRVLFDQLMDCNRGNLPRRLEREGSRSGTAG